MTAPADRLADVLLQWLARRLSAYTPPRRPRRPAVSPLREDPDMALIYTLQLPPPGAPDVVRRVLTTVVGGAEPTTKDVVDGEEIRFEQDDQVVLTLVDIDDAGNASLPSEPLSFVASDTIAPPQPGTLGLAEVREE